MLQENIQKIELYESPSIKLISVNINGILCQSGNEPMGFEDLGDGGFH